MVGQNGVQVDYEILDIIQSVVSKMAFKAIQQMISQIKISGKDIMEWATHVTPAQISFQR